MILEDDIVIKSGFGRVPSEIPVKFHKYSDYIDQYFNGSKDVLRNIHHKQTATTFYESVWAEMSKIPYGKTLSYKELAENIQNPKAVRAVGSACGKNNLPIIVPCHRVIKSDGMPGNYAFGTKIKKYLLELESKK